MSYRNLGRTALVLAMGIFLVAGSAQAMGKKAPVEKEHELGQAGTMKKTYDPETGVKRMEKTIGGGEKTMTLEKEPHSGATVERSWTTGPEAGKSSGAGGPSSHPGGGKGKGKW